MRESDRNGVLETTLPRTRHQQRRHSRRLRYSGPFSSLSLSLFSFSIVCFSFKVFFHACARAQGLAIQLPWELSVTNYTMDSHLIERCLFGFTSFL